MNISHKLENKTGCLSDKLCVEAAAVSHFGDLILDYPGMRLCHRGTPHLINKPRNLPAFDRHVHTSSVSIHYSEFIQHTLYCGDWGTCATQGLTYPAYKRMHHCKKSARE